MEQNEAVRNAVGFAMKAGKLASGDFAADKAVKSGRAHLIIVDSDASDNTKKHWRDTASSKNIKLITIENLGCAIGKEARMVAAVTDEGFARMIYTKTVQKDGMDNE